MSDVLASDPSRLYRFTIREYNRPTAIISLAYFGDWETAYEAFTESYNDTESERMDCIQTYELAEARNGEYIPILIDTRM